MAAPVSITEAGRADIGEPRALLTLPNGVDVFEPSQDGQRFLVSRLVGEEPTPTITVLLNWAGARR